MRWRADALACGCGCVGVQMHWRADALACGCVGEQTRMTVKKTKRIKKRKKKANLLNPNLRCGWWVQTVGVDGGETRWVVARSMTQHLCGEFGLQNFCASLRSHNVLLINLLFTTKYSTLHII